MVDPSIIIATSIMPVLIFLIIGSILFYKKTKSRNQTLKIEIKENQTEEKVLLLKKLGNGLFPIKLFVGVFGVVSLFSIIMTLAVFARRKKPSIGENGHSFMLPSLEIMLLIVIAVIFVTTIYALFLKKKEIVCLKLISGEMFLFGVEPTPMKLISDSVEIGYYSYRVKEPRSSRYNHMYLCSLQASFGDQGEKISFSTSMSGYMPYNYYQWNHMEIVPEFYTHTPDHLDQTEKEVANVGLIRPKYKLSEYDWEFLCFVLGLTSKLSKNLS